MDQLSGLNADEIARLLAILEMSSSSFGSISTAFTEAFPVEKHGGVVVALRMLLDKPLGLCNSIEHVPQTLIAYHLLRLILAAAQNVRRNPVPAMVRATLFHELQHLESLLREDARIEEAHKYKQSQSGGQGSKKLTGKEAGETDVARCRLLLKTVIFRQLLQRPEADSVEELLATPKTTLEAEAATWSSQAPVKQALIEAVSELKAAAESENALSMGHTSARTAVFEKHPGDNSLNAPSCTMTPAWTRPLPTKLAVGPNELRFLCAPAASSSLVVDAAPYSAEWKTATSLLATARSQSLSATQHQQLVASASKCAGHLGLTIPAFIDVSAQNPQTAAQLLASIPQPELYIDALIALPNAAGCLRSEVLLSAASALQPHQLSAYIKAMVSYIRSAAKPPLETVSNFAVTLHQLSKKQELSKGDCDLVSPLFTEFASSVSDVSSLWASLIKS
uniref:CCR4-NOT transcription complex subunit 11 n=1 Tax=Neobodo designis TaxID=312471 RepID=A0A7S1Q823_NEODS|mmetsp:Transcript_3606/g.11286  ORF Transcript_3606/g.11286 Transcript_3606/m.11286 type:complete len:451 (+) Transcript_3606:30-1382(+)|eukprot:CAMPEP_0174853162 /NCGR_PEP_ID=MMETSP1114-20130205/27388_1 /TAXON_ID=312471 /ORGANISM="Neobodo designis, Strain CCAP 1951/1" /LENGTH=450 /DNA_ID=CAMNT_0016087783 /DNA_START=28 /DNA_END=1380 /DNA_ORIENTATION=+